ncbi:MAG: head-tail adaptor protein [Bacteroidales bacterium]|nr:head-tail adaptor protein [Bacteroidales bacterium]
MIAGKLTERVTLQYPYTVKDEFGSESTHFHPGVTVHAQVTWKTGAISRDAAEFFPTDRIEVVIYDAHQCEAKWRVIYEGETYQVVAVERVRLRGLKRLFCEKVNL